jgi:hypothetical protein
VGKLQGSLPFANVGVGEGVDLAPALGGFNAPAAFLDLLPLRSAYGASMRASSS